MKKLYIRLFTILCTAAMLFLCAGKHPAYAESLPVSGGIWLAASGDVKIYYLFAEDGTGSLFCGQNRHTFTYTQESDSITLLLEGRHPEALTLIGGNGGYSAVLTRGMVIPFDYLQTLTADAAERFYIDGDMTQDGDLSAYDAQLMQRALLGNYAMSDIQRSLADISGDRRFDAADLSLMKQFLLYPDTVPEIPDFYFYDDPEPEPEPILKDAVMLDGVPEYNQHPEYPTGCESIALYILLRYYGTEVTPAQIISALPKGPLPYLYNGAYYGANPEREFVGDPTTGYSYGVFNQPIAQTAELFRSGAKTKKGAALEELWPILSAGHPVIAWYTTTPYRDIVYKNAWYDYQTGELIRWPGGEHAVVVCGYDLNAGELTYRDPNTGGSRTLPIEHFRKIYDELGGRIVWYEE